MQYVNDDMDDVFRKAGEEYPLDTSGSDWSKVAAGLQGREALAEPVRKKDRRKFLWLLMLLPMALVCNYYNSIKEGAKVVGNNATTDNGTVSKNKVENNLGGQPGENDSTNPSLENKGREAEAEVSGGEMQMETVKSQEQNSLTIEAEKLLSKKQEDNSILKNNSEPEASTVFQKPKQHKAINKKGSSSLTNVKSTDAAGAGHTFPDNLTDNNSISQPHYYFVNKIDHTIFFPGPVHVHPTAMFDPVVKSKMKTSQSTGKKTKHFYAGLMGGIDLTTIKFQRTDKAGFDYGVLMGYRFNKRWGVEAAAFMDKKYYYTEGKYFKNSKIYLPPNTWITDVTGNCRMLDLSLGANYSFAQKTRSAWFATAGLSSYIMKKEAYDYTYYYASSGTSAVHSKSYTNSSKNYFAIGNISAGYTHKLGEVADLRIEPYIKIPISGVGFGHLPLLSGGLHVGVTRKLF